MALVVVAIFDEVYEGEIAASLLRSAGIQAWLLGDQLAKLYPFKQRAWGGCRLAVAEHEAEDAQAILDMARNGELADPEASDQSEPTGSAMAGPAAILGLFGGAEAGWALSGARRRPSAFRIIAAVLIVLSVLPLVLGVAIEELYLIVTDIIWLSAER